MVDESARLASLHRYEILDTEPDESFDRIARIAMDLFQAPIGMINLIDSHRQWTKSAIGAERGEIAREESFCTWTIKNDEPLVLRDASKASLFKKIPKAADAHRYRFYAGAPLRDRSGYNLGALCCLDYQPRSPSDAQVTALQDLAKLTVELMDLRHVATIDGLTGAMTRRSFIDAAKRDVVLSIRHRRPLSVIMIDLDHFKRINDTYGHAAGDYVLKHASSLLSEQLRGSDYIGRLGGEEFGVVLRETPAPNAFALAERLRRTLAEGMFRFAGAEFPITASLGVAGLEPTVSDIHALLSRADASLYAAKAVGRNRTMMLTPEMAPPPS